VWKLAVSSSLSPDEVILRILQHFSSVRWNVYYIEGAYVIEGPHAYLLFSVLSFMIAIIIFFFHPLLSLIPAIAGALLLGAKHAIALVHQDGVYLLVANSYEAYLEAIRFAEKVGRIIYLEGAKQEFLIGTNFARALDDLRATVVKIAESEGATRGERGEARLLSSTEVRAPLARQAEVAEYRAYLATLEEMYKKGEVKEEIYRKLKEEYEKKLRELENF